MKHVFLLPLLFFSVAVSQCYAPRSHGVKEGVVIGYHDNGAVASKTVYKDGKKNGPYVSLYDDGKVHSESQFVNDSLVGYSVTYYNNGRKNFDVFRNDDHNLDGISRFWYENGMLGDSGAYSNGKFEGRWFHYLKDGRLKEVNNYTNGKLDGLTVEFKENGDTLKVQLFEAGRLLKQKDY